MAVGRAICLHGRKRQFFKAHIEKEHSISEISRFRNAMTTAKAQLEDLVASENSVAGNARDIFDVQLLIIEHSGIEDEVVSLIKEQSVNAEWALKEVTDLHVARQSAVSDEKFRDRSIDIQDVAERILTDLIGSNESVPELDSNSVVVASSIRPSTILELARHRPKAIVTEHGGWTSHAFIMARELKIPAVTGVKDVMDLVSDGDEVAVDGFLGRLYIAPESETVSRMGRIIDNIPSSPHDIPTILPASKTLDGREITIRANVEQIDGVTAIREAGAKGIGLLRSEYLFSAFANGFPSEDEQTAAYSSIVTAMNGEVVRIRTFDISSDHLSFTNVNREGNPALGLRAIRLSLSDEQQFRVQLRSILRASAAGNASFVFPMVSGIDELVRSRSLIDAEVATLRELGVTVPEPNVGVMIEVPSAVLTVDSIVKLVDFVCIGTNDLVQYLLAVDRDNETVAKYYQTLHPAVISSIASVIRAADGQGIPTIMCGEMAGSAFYTPLLVGLGAREFSMNVNSIKMVRDVVSGISFEEAAELARSVVSLANAADIDQRLRDFYAEKWPHLFPPQFLNIAAAERK